VIKKKKKKKTSLYTNKAAAANLLGVLGRKNTSKIRSFKLYGKSLFIFSVDNRIRNFIAKMVNHSYFDNCILILIFLSTLTLTLENPYQDPDGQLNYIL